MNDTNDLDNKIRKALSNQDAQMLGGSDDELRIDQLVFSVFKTRNRAATYLLVGVSVIILGLSVYCAIQFFEAQETKELLSWSMGFILGMLMISFMKVWFWMEMQRIAVTREIKRVELLTARLLQELSTK